MSGERIASRLETGAANAWEERDWVRSDLLALAGRRRLDLRNPDQGRRVADALQGFYDRAAAVIDHAVEQEAVPENDRLVRTLRSLGRIMQTEGKVEFRGDAHAERFAEELRQRYGKGVIADLAAGKTDALARDIEGDQDRRWIARAVVSAAKAHVAFGLTLSAARESERGLREAGNPEARDWER